MVLEHAILMEKNWLLAPQIEQLELMKKLNKLKENNATENGSDDGNDNKM